MALEIPRFDPKRLCHRPFTMCLIARRHSGKTNLIKDLLYHLHCSGYPRCVVFNGTEEGNEEYGRILPRAYVHGGHFRLEKLQKIVDTQKVIVKACRKTQRECQVDPGVDTRLLVVLDDLMFQKNITRCELFNELFFNGRHWNISLILSSQYVMSLDIGCRSNVDYLVCLQEQIPRNRQKLYDNFFGMFDDKKDFFRVLDWCTRDYSCMILDSTTNSMSIEDSIRWYRAQYPVPAFTFGSSTYKRLARPA